MRLIFLLLLITNAAFIIWRFGIGLPLYFQSSAALTSVLTPIEAPQRLTLVAESELQPSTVEQQAVPAPLCKMVGPFAGEAAATQFIARLAALDITAQIHQVELSSGENYWVYFPAESSREEARRRLALLQSRGIDSYLIPKGELENGISVGVFSKRSSADARLLELQAMGYEPQILTVPRSHKEIWVILNKGEKQKIADSAWRSLVNETFSLQEQENLCLEVASH